jgi:hypothetical protein
VRVPRATDDHPIDAEADETQRRHRLYVGIDSIGPDLSWIASPPAFTRQARVRLFVSIAVACAFVGFIGWAVSSSHGVLAAYVLLCVIAIIPVWLVIALGWAALGMLRRRLTHEPNGT